MLPRLMIYDGLLVNRLELLKGDRIEQYSLRINNQYRICFQVKDINCFYNVEIVDYH